jgi:hypothetical protein
MPAPLRTWCLAAIVAVLVVCGFAGASSASWITIKNETGQTIIVQESVVVNGHVRRGKAKTLLPGETLREFLPGPTVKRVEVLDALQPTHSLWCGNLSCKDANQVFSVSSANSKVAVAPVATPSKK